MFRRRPAFAISMSIAALLMLIAAASFPGVAQAKDSKVYGPFASESPDSSTCGNNWATDSFDRTFEVMKHPKNDGTYTVFEYFQNGSFVTFAGDSAGGCDTNPGGVISEGVTGSMDGDFTIIVSGGKYKPNGCKFGDCSTTAGFVAAVFGDGATYDIPSFYFEYNAYDGQGLSQTTWINASADRGGNSGDIAS